MLPVRYFQPAANYAVVSPRCHCVTTIAYRDEYGRTLSLNMPSDHLATLLLGVGVGVLAAVWLSSS